MDSGCDLLHGGWGPSARDAELAEGLSITGVAWTGPTIEQLGVAAARHRLRELARGLQIPVVPASGPLDDQAKVEAWLAYVGTPAVARSLDPRLPRVAVSDGGEGIEAVIRLLRHGPVSLERLVVGAREVELPFLGNGSSVVVLASRDTSVRHAGGRVFVESPAPGLTPELRATLRQSVARLAAHLAWRGLGTARFLLTPDQRPYLLQLKAGLLPWHGVTEEVLGIDLVDTQVCLALDEPMLWGQSQVEPRGHCLTVQLRAWEAGALDEVRWPKGVRVDGGPCSGDLVEAREIVGMLTVTAPTRQASIVRMRVALDEVEVSGPTTDLGALRALFDEPDLWHGPVDRDRAARVLSDAQARLGLR